MSSSSEREIWTLISPHSCNKRKKKQLARVWKIACRCRCFSLDVMIDCQLQQLTGRKDGKNAHNTGFGIDLILTRLQAQQDPSASDRLHLANANVHMDSLLCMRSCKHSAISSWASCVSVSSTESQWETLDDDPQSQRSTIWPCWVDVCHEGLVCSLPVAN